MSSARAPVAHPSTDALPDDRSRPGSSSLAPAARLGLVLASAVLLFLGSHGFVSAATAPDVPSPHLTGPLWLEGSSAWNQSDAGLSAARIGGRLPIQVLRRTHSNLELALVHAGDLGASHDHARVDAVLRFANPGSALWLGIAGRHQYDDGRTKLALLGLGFSRTLKEVALSAALEQSEDTETRRTITALSESLSFESFEERPVTRTSVHAGFQWLRGRVEVESATGVSVSSSAGPRHWIRSRVAFAITRQVALVASASSRAPELFGVDEAAGRQASLGFRVTPWGTQRSTPPEVADPPSGESDASGGSTAAGTSTAAAGGGAGDASASWRVTSQGEGWYLIELRLPGTRAVEIAGDATGWNPMALEPLGDGRWQTRIQLAPGVHHVNVRVDGGDWRPPAGLPTTEDDYNGTVGVLVIES